MLKRKKVDLFALWLDHGQDWGRVTCQVERAKETSNLARKEWGAVKAKTLKAEMDEEKYKDLIKKRTDQGLYYKDEDYPDDPEDNVFTAVPSTASKIFMVCQSAIKYIVLILFCLDLLQR